MKESEKLSQASEASRLSQWAEWQSRLRAREMGAIAEGNEEPMLFVLGEVLIGREEIDLITECIAKGGEIIPQQPFVEPPIEIRRTREINPVDFPRPVRIRFMRPVQDETPGRTLCELQERRYEGRHRKPIFFSDPISASIASFAGRKSSEGRNILLNVVGNPSTLPLLAPQEGATLREGSDAEGWLSFQSPTRIAQAWQFVESVRLMRSIEPVVWVGILDNGFWVDPQGVPLPGAGEAASDFGLGVAGFNLLNPGANVTGANGYGSPWHGHRCASVAAAIVGNHLGAAGTGGTVARPFLFKSDYSMDKTIDCLNYATWWGIDILNMSFGRKICSFLWWDDIPNLYDETFQVAHDNGVIVIASAGNDNEKLPDTHRRPATRTPGVITVGALQPTLASQAGGVPVVELEASPFSNFGSSVSIWAPGVDIPVAPDDTTSDGTFSGTSAAAPFVAGVVAMMRALNPAITPANVRETLIRTGWSGPNGSKVTKGLDAFAAVLDVMSNTLPTDLGEPNHTPQTPAQLFETGSGALKPFGGYATFVPGKADYWKFHLNEISNVTIELGWYYLLTDKLTLDLTSTDTNNESISDMTRSIGRGLIRLNGILWPGDYVLRISDGKLTAYELSVTPKKDLIKADVFEPNDSFKTASRFFFHPTRLSPFSEPQPAWGPGDYDATLHRRFIQGVGFLAVNPDYFELHVPAETDHRISQVFIGRTAFPLNVSLYDSSHHIIQYFENQKQVLVKPPPGTVCYLKVSGEHATRYKISVGRWVDPAILPPGVGNVNSFPPWWKNASFAIRPGINYFAIDVDPEHDNGRIIFAPASGEFHLHLLDMTGALVRTSTRDRERHTLLDTSGLALGTYLVKVDYVAPGASPLFLKFAAPLKFDK